jgi:O-antigen/teichoic acid export membrane protein
MATTALNKLLDFGLAVIMFRALGADGVGRYTWVVLVVGYFDILMNFGLGVLITREVARQPAAAGRYLGSALLTRAALWLLAVAVALVMVGPLAEPLGITPEMGVALVFFTVGVGISNLAGVVSALFTAREQMEFPALVTVFTTSLKFVLYTVALTLGYGIVGLATVSIAVNLATALVLALLFMRVVGRPRLTVSAQLSLALVGASVALMINNLLSTVFFRIDGLILRGFAGDMALGWYSAAYRFVDGLNLIPSSLTLALFPVLARLAVSARAEHGVTSEDVSRDPEAEGAPRGSALLRATKLALKVLLTLALPISVGTMLLADPIVRLVAGVSYLPHAAVALQILIWLVPFSFVNGLLQYVLISVNQQRFVTVAFVIAVAFNVSVNLILVPLWSYLGAAVVTVLSEVVLLGPFWYAVQRHVGSLRLLPLAWRPAVAAAAMAPGIWLLRDSPVLAIMQGLVMYPLVLLAVGGLDATDRRLIRNALHRA